MMKRWGCLVLVTALLLSSCRKENFFISKNTDNQAVFSSVIAGLPQTRAQGTQWGANDSIGIFMYQNGTSLNASTIVNDGFNRPYITNGNGNFSSKNADESLIYPADAPVDFVAYYPFQRRGELSPLIDVSNQDDQPVLDFMVARNTAGATVGQGPVSLSFERQMTKLQLQLKGTDLTGVTASFVGLPSKASFDLSAGQFIGISDPRNVSAKVSTNTSGETLVEWTLFPMNSTVAQKIVFTKANGSTYTWNIDANTPFAKGHRYQYDINLGSDGTVDPTPTAAYMELPVITSGTNLQYSLKMSSATKRNYSMLYDTQNKLAYWVAYPLSNDYLGSQSRTDAWGYDPDYSTSFQANLSSGYPNNAALDIDRGHQLPSGDRTYNRAENVSTFYYTNMTPQVKSLNQQVWARLEDKIRAWTTQSGVDTMYVVTGGMIKTATDNTIEYVNDNSGRPVAKPKYYYKVLAMKRGTSYYTIGFRFNNVATDNRADYMNYTKTVAEIEQETGFTFFPALPSTVKSTIDRQIWN